MTFHARRARLRVGLLLAAGLLSLKASALPAPTRAAEHSALTVQVSSWVLPSRPLEITLEQRGVLAGRHLAVLLFIDENQFERLETQNDRTRILIAIPPLAPGRHRLIAKTGREVAQTEFRVIPWSWPAGAAGGLLVACSGLGLALARRRRRSQGGRP